jgi:hypothetical protein
MTTNADTNESDAIRGGEMNPLGRFFLAPFRLRTYTNLLYLLLAFPLGLAYFIFLIVGLSLGFGLTLIWIGIPLLALVFAGSRAFAACERQAAILLLGAAVPPMAPMPPPPGAAARTIWQRTGDFFGNPVTWKGMGFLLIKLPLGVVSFVAIVGLLSVSAAFLLAPAAALLENSGWLDVDGLVIEVSSVAGVWTCALLGILLTLLSLNLLNALALVWRATATLLLGSDQFAAPSTPLPLPALPEGIAAT